MKQIRLLAIAAFAMGIFTDCKADAQSSGNGIDNTVDSTEKTMDDAAQDEVAEFVLGGGKIGPLYLGQPISAVPSSVKGLYDKVAHKKEKHEDEMDGDWIEDYLQFTKDGKEVLRSTVYNNKIHTFQLGENSEFIKTEEGYYVGYPVRDLFSKKPKEWTIDFQAGTYLISGDYTYFMDYNDLIDADWPEKVEDIKPNAKITLIVHYIER